MQSYKQQYDAYVAMINDELQAQMSHADLYPKMQVAMSYSLFGGGKRMRSVLVMATNELFGGAKNHVLPFAAAMEMIHCYSLIHDDLPAMDNDQLRRGQPTNHVQFGEANAILAGDALLNYAFEIMLDHTLTIENNPSQIKACLCAMQCLAVHSGARRGMIAGQAADLTNEGNPQAGILELGETHSYKTGALISAGVLMGALLCSADEKSLLALESYSHHLGMAFQINDDILDVVGEPEKLGKTPGKDINANKLTFVRVYGLDLARNKANQETDEAVAALDPFGEKASFLRELALRMSKRDH